MPDVSILRDNPIAAGREEKKANDLFYVCSLIEYIARKTRNRTADVVDALGSERVAKIYELADVYHSDNIDRVADDFIAESGLTAGNDDKIDRAKYAVPSHWDMGKIIKRLILGVADRRQTPIVDALFDVYRSPVAEKLDDYNCSFYYDAPENILNAYLYGEIE